MKCFRGYISVPYEIFCGSPNITQKERASTVDCTAFVVAKTKKRCTELIGTNYYWFNKGWRIKEKPESIPLEEGIWWTTSINIEKYPTIWKRTNWR